MNPLEANPLGILTFIVAPAILTNASSIMTLGTSNRFARAIDRVRVLSAQLEGKEADLDPEVRLRIRQLRSAERRVLLLVRALASFYLSVGAFGAASLTSLVSGVFYVAHWNSFHQGALFTALGFGCLGVLGLATGSGILMWETSLALQILTEETDFHLQRTKPKMDAPA